MLSCVYHEFVVPLSARKGVGPALIFFFERGKIFMKHPAYSYAALMLGVAALSTSAIFVKLADAPSSVTAFYRLLFSALALFPFLALDHTQRAQLRALRPARLGQIALSGLLLAIHYVLWFESLRFTSVSSSTVLVALQPLFSLLFSFLLLGERPRKSAVVGCLIAVTGSAVIGWGDLQISAGALLGDLLALAAAGVISLYFLIGQVARKEIGAIAYSVPGYFSSAVFLLAYALLRGDGLTGYSAGTWGAFLGLALISTIGGQFIFNLLLKNISATAVTMGILGEPVGTCILAFFLLHERIAPRQFAGIAVILAGLSVYFFHPVYVQRRKARAPSSP